MKFSIITATYKRPELLRRTINSVKAQTYDNWEMIIINDSTNDGSYGIVEGEINNNPKIKYIVNENNFGLNAARNKALDTVSSDSDWIVLLDDDDYFDINALLNLKEVIDNNPNIKWIIVNRMYKDGKTITQVPKDNTSYLYAWDYLIFRKIQGDATHCINRSLIYEGKKIYFPTYIRTSEKWEENRFKPKNILQKIANDFIVATKSTRIYGAEEWIFYFDLSTKTKLFYSNKIATLTDGYSDTGLNNRIRTCSEQLGTLRLVIKEGISRKIIFYPSFIIYILMRTIRAFIKK